MSKQIRSLLGFGLPIIAIVIFTILLAFSLLRISNIDKEMRMKSSTNMLWVASRAHIASLQLNETASLFMLNKSDRADLSLKYDLFLSTIVVLMDGPQRRALDEFGFGQALSDFQQDLNTLTILISTLSPGNLQQAYEINTLLEPLNKMLSRAATIAMITEWDDLGQKLDTARNFLWQIIISLLGITVSGVILLIHSLLIARAARERSFLLDKEKAFSELLIASSGEGIIAVDANHYCTIWNEAAERLFLLSAAKTLGRPISDISGFFQTGRIKQAIEDAIDGFTIKVPDCPYFPPASEDPVYIDLRCYSLRSNGNIIGAIILVSDTTERQIRQKAIAEQQDRLEFLVAERTQELDEALARERNTADLYRNFGTMISHQIRTPLAIVDSSLQRLMRRKNQLSPVEVVERGEKARHAIARLIKLVDSTLDAARLDAGQIEIRPQICDFGALICQICAANEELFPERLIILKQPLNQPVLVYCDPVHAEHILVNLLSNAIKYSPSDRPITILVRINDKNAECCVFNFGEVLDQEQQKDLFERYYRGKNAEGRPGIGIGLYMARALANMQNGSVWFNDEERDQNCFVLALPLANEPLTDTQKIAIEKTI